MTTETDVADAIIDKIRITADVKEKFVLAGLIRKPFKSAEGEQSCSTCIHFHPRHEHCGLPELDFPGPRLVVPTLAALIQPSPIKPMRA